MFYEALWRDHWQVEDNIGDVPGEPVGSDRWLVPDQPEMNLRSIELINVPEGLLSKVRVKVG